MLTNLVEEASQLTAKRILFVCVENACRSQMAEAFARMHPVDGVEVYSSGSKPSGQINAKAIEAMQELGYDMSGHRSFGLEQLPDRQFDAVITMGCGDQCPLVGAQLHEDWQLPDPKHFDHAAFCEVRDLIGERVEALMQRLA